jgi:predicted transcriptional regulator
MITIVPYKKRRPEIFMPATLLESSHDLKGSPAFSAVEAVRRKGADTDWTLYQVVDKHPGESIYALSKIVGWSTGKVYASVKRLAEDGLVRVEKSMRDGRGVLVVKPLEWQEFFTPDELQELKDMDF